MLAMATTILISLQLALPIRGLLPVAMGAPSRRPCKSKHVRRVKVVPMLMPCETVPCRLSGTVMVRACLEMRSKLWPSGRRKGTPMKRACVDCPLGEDYAQRAPWFVPKKASQAAEVLSPSQRAAKAKWKAEHEIDDQPWMDPMKEAAMLTPDEKDDGTPY